MRVDVMWKARQERLEEESKRLRAELDNVQHLYVQAKADLEVKGKRIAEMEQLLNQKQAVRSVVCYVHSNAYTS